MTFNKDSVAGTFVFIIVLCLVCSFMITGTADVLKERKLAKQRDALMQNVLLAAGIDADKSGFSGLFAERVTPLLLTLPEGSLQPQADLLDYDERMAAVNPQTSSKIRKDMARIKTRANAIRVFRIHDSGGKTQGWVLPVYGKGLWSLIYGFVGVGRDVNTIKAVVFYEHGETPGITDFISDPHWLGQWHGKQLFDEHGQVALKVVKGGAKAGDVHGVDGISGATRTGVGIEKMMGFWFGAEGFAPALQQLRAED
ncbi:Na(+)-translocating NADH-quinone reductase subunit C [Shewanella sp. YIC-542]|uniref:Na(+)-translocating NADH-quinone reductase subunit C n=1 Tax=Shewanella mytili TaxID=3377111 RepID=UPI00398EF2C6